MIQIKFLYEYPDVSGPQDFIGVVDVNRARKYLVGGNEPIGKLSKNLRIEFDFRSKETFEFTCEGDFWTLDQLLRAIVRGYRYMYQAPRRYGVYGHVIEDLVIEAIYMTDDGKKITLAIGS